MFTLSYLVSFFWGLIFLLLGWVLNHFIAGRKVKDLKPEYDKLQKEYSNLGKALKKEKGIVEQMRNKAESWKQETQAANQNLHQKTKELKGQIEELNLLLKDSKDQQSKIKTEKERLASTLEKTQKELEKLKMKYQRDVADGKDWINERSKMEREIKDLTSKLEKSTLMANDYKKKYDKQAEEINKIRVMERELRMNNTKIKTLEKDITYWEKKHYDTHHELAALKIEHEALGTQLKDLDQLRKGDEILKENLMSQIKEFKNKFVDVNNKYRDLVGNGN
jgi:chromosome segregation ATPase